MKKGYVYKITGTTSKGNDFEVIVNFDNNNKITDEDIEEALRVGIDNLESFMFDFIPS